jgi:hypothetical protein
MVDTIKFSEFLDGGDLEPNQTTVGLEAGVNASFNNPFPLLPAGTTGGRPAPAASMYYRLRFNTTLESYEYYSPILPGWIQLEDSADIQSSPFVIYTADPLLPSSFNLGSLGDGLLMQEVLAGVSTPSIAVNGTDYYGPGYTGYLVSPSGIADADGNPIINTLTAGLFSVNYFGFTNSLSGDDLSISAIGPDLHIGINIAPKGDGYITLDGLIWPIVDGAADQALITDGAGNLVWGTVPIVTVPTLDQSIARFNGTNGAIEDSGVTIDDSDVMSGITQLNVDNLRLDGNSLISTNANGAINITPNGTGDINLRSFLINSASEGSGLTKLTVDNIVIDGDAIQHLADLDNQILFGADTQSFETGGVSRLDLSNSGMRLGAANARVTTILTDSTMAGATDTNLYTGLAIKTYVDAIATGLNVQGSCVAASTTALTVTYNNGAAGVGATLTNAGAMAAISLDGISPTVGQRVLIKNQASTFQNGIYTVTTVGSGAVNWVLTRATDYDTAAEIQPGDFVIITSGTLQANSSWIETETVVTVGTDPIIFAQFSASIPVSLANGGTGASLIASNGGIFYSTATAGAILAGTATANQLLMSGSNTAPHWSTATYPSTASSAGKILRADGTNWAASTATYPDVATSAGKILRADGTNWAASTATYPNTATSAGKLLRADGTNWVESTATYPGTATSTGTFLRANGTDWLASTMTLPNTATVNRLLWVSATNVVSDLATANNGTLITSAAGVPSISSTLPSAVQTNITSLGTIGNNPTFSSGLGFGGGVNSLNYYTENGAWTPVFTFATPGTLSVVYTIQSGIYTRVGNVVFVECQLSFTPTLGTASGNMRVTQFPFAFGSNAMSLGISQQNAIPTFTGGRTYSWILGSSGNTFAQWVTAGSALGASNMNTANFTSGAATQFNFSGVYLV